MNTRNLFIGSFLFLGLFLSCEDYTERVNTDPNSFTDTSEELLIKQAELQLVESLTGFPPLLAAVFSDQYTGSEFEWETFDNYEINSREFNGMWADFFTWGYSQAELARNKASISGNQVLEGIAEIHMASFMG